MTNICCHILLLCFYFQCTFLTELLLILTWHHNRQPFWSPSLEHLTFWHVLFLALSAKTIIYALSPLIAGLGSCLSIWCNNMAKQIVFVIIFGTTSGKFMIKRPNSNVHIELSWFINWCGNIISDLSLTYMFPVLCDIINMCDLEKAIGAFHSFEGLILLGFIPLSGMEISTRAHSTLLPICWPLSFPSESQQTLGKVCDGLTWEAGIKWIFTQFSQCLWI